MIFEDKIKTFDDKIKASQAQYELDREAAKSSALSSKKLEKYEYLTGKDLKYKPRLVEQAKFEYSPFGKIFNKGLEENEKTDRILKRLGNIEDANEKQLQVIKDELVNLPKRLKDDKPKLSIRYQIDEQNK